MPGTSHPSSLVPGAPGAHLRWAVVVTSYFLSLLYVLLTARLWVHAVEPSRVVGLRCPTTDFEQVCGAAQAALRISRVVSDVVRAHGVAGGRYGEI